MTGMIRLKQETVDPDNLAPVADADIGVAHRVWMNDQIQQALDHKRSGQATYKTLEDVRRKFGF